MCPLIRTLIRSIWVNPLPLFGDARRMSGFISGSKTINSVKPGAIHFGVVLVPWGSTAVPWFSMACGMLLGARGNKVTFIVDDMPFGDYVLANWLQIRCLLSVLRLLRGHNSILRVSKHISDADLSQDARKTVDRLAILNAVWALRGEMEVSDRQRQIGRFSRQLQNSYEPIASIVEHGDYDALLVPGGVWGSSGMWVEHARAAGVRVASYDSGGHGTLLLAVSGLACQLNDIPRAFSMLKTHAESRSLQSFIVETAISEMGRRRAGSDAFASQVQIAREIDASFSGAVLIALNSSWDSAALGLHAVFANSTQWIIETSKYLLDQTSATVVVRQHPVERLKIASTSDDYRSLLVKQFGNHPRIRFIAANDPVNSYDLLERVAMVVVHTSTFGIEAAAHGKVVITTSNSYYSDMDFVQKANEKMRYFEVLSNALTGEYAVTPTMRHNALCCYYLTQCCNWLVTPFNVPNYKEWSSENMNQLIERGDVKMILQALEQNIPIAFLNHLVRLPYQHDH